MSFAQSSQHTFIQYAIGLTFAVLGLSIQTSHFGSSIIADALEILAWLALLSSGMLGLARWEKVPQIYQMFGVADVNDTYLSKLRFGKAQGVRDVTSVDTHETEPIDKTLQRVGEEGKKIAAMIEEANAKSSRMYNAQKGLFVSGFILLAAARSAIPVTRMLVVLMRRTPY
jgi:hypothetical protein